MITMTKFLPFFYMWHKQCIKRNRALITRSQLPSCLFFNTHTLQCYYEDKIRTLLCMFSLAPPLIGSSYVWLIISLGVPLTLKGRRASVEFLIHAVFNIVLFFSQSSLAIETIFSCLPYIRCSVVLSQLNKKCCRHLGIGWLMEPECGGFFQRSPEAPSLKYIHDVEWLNLFIRLFLI